MAAPRRVCDCQLIAAFVASGRTGLDKVMMGYLRKSLWNVLCWFSPIASGL